MRGPQRKSRTLVYSSAKDLPVLLSCPKVPAIHGTYGHTVHWRQISCWSNYLEKLFLEKSNKMAVAAGRRELTHHGSEE